MFIKNFLIFSLLLFAAGSVYAQECELDGMATYTQGGWGAPANGGNAGSIRDAYFDEVFPNDLVISGVYTLRLTSAAAVKKYLPAGGTPTSMHNNVTDPTKKKEAGGVFGGQLVALKLNIEFDAASHIGSNDNLLGSLIITDGPFEGITVNNFFDMAALALTSGDTQGYSFSELNYAATAINENFDDGDDNEGFLTCGSQNPDEDKVDLSLTKSVNNDNPEDGDEITFTVTLRNDGNVTATGITVKDFLPEELIYESYSVSSGGFDVDSLVWALNGLNAGAQAVLTLTVLVENATINNSIFDLGAASDYNLFVMEDVNQPSSDTEGRMAVGRNATLAEYSVGFELDPDNAGDVLIVGEHLTYESGRVFYGNCVYGVSTSLEGDEGIVDGDIIQGTPIDFPTARVYLETLSDELSEYKNNGTVVQEYSKITLFGSNPSLNVFTVAGDDLTAATEFEINSPNGSVVLVNINGDNIELAGGFNVFGTSMRNVLLNFHNVTDLQIHNIDVTGSILAPKADVDFTSGVQNGQMIAKSVVGTGQFNNKLFLGNVPSDAALINVAELISCDQFDLDSTPGNGEEGEDDYSSVVISISVNDDSGDPPGSSFGEWQYIGGFGEDEIVLCVEEDADGNILAGTWGGKISRSTDMGVNWTQINEDQDAVFIWDLLVDGTNIFASTEIGIILSTDNGTSWASAGLDTFDVRALELKDDKVFAGTWGGGIYYTENNGADWTSFNTGLTEYAVHALTIDSHGTIFAGTYGAGVFRLTSGSDSWEHLDVGYRFIWTLDVTSTDYIFAGSYGAGLFRSLDGGDTWTKQFDGLYAQYIYSITVDGNDNIFAGSWANGVFASDDYGDSWLDLGLNGFGVNIVFSGDDDEPLRAANGFNNIYAGTSSGRIYWNSPITEVRSETGNAVTFELFQNYPNPFNPMTKIKYSIPNSVETLRASPLQVSLKIYDILGREAATLVNEEKAPGVYEVSFDASILASGVYFYRLIAGDFVAVKKLILLR